MENNIKSSSIIAVVGLAGSGKTDTTRQFIECGFFRVGFNDVFYEEFAKSGLEMNEPNERKIREGLRAQFGEAVMAVKSLPKIERALGEGKRVVLESLYSWAEYKLMKEKFGDSFRVLAIYAPPKLRYARLASRPVRPLIPDIAKSRDWAEIENLKKAGPITLADWTIQNTGSKEEFMEEVERFLHTLSWQ